MDFGTFQGLGLKDLVFRFQRWGKVGNQFKHILARLSKEILFGIHPSTREAP